MYFIAWLEPVMPFIEYQINKKYIAEVLCENKDKPKMHCNGKCHLKKQLKKANNQETGSELPVLPSSKTEQLTTLLFEKKHSFLKLIYLKKIITTYIENYQFLFEKNIFHPPKSY